MLEFHPSLSIASRVPEALKYALQVSDVCGHKVRIEYTEKTYFCIMIL